MTHAFRDSARPTRAPSPTPYPPMQLSRRAQAALIGLRLFLCLTTAMAIFTVAHAPSP